MWVVRKCVIFNPAAKGDKARRLRRHLDEIAVQATLKLTTCAGDARRLATEAVNEGFEVVVAAGGDGTVNEVLNGIGDAPDGFKKTVLGVLPLGTVNVFARELAIPQKPELAWPIILAGLEKRIDLPWVEDSNNGTRARRYFAQLAGAGLDARACELVRWETKKKIGVFAYVLAGLQALAGAPARMSVSAPGQSCTGGLVLIGNGRLYGGSFRIFPKADLRDGLLEVCVFPKLNWLTLARCGPQLLLRGGVPSAATVTFRAETVELTSPDRVPFELDGELVGILPATFSVPPLGLRVIAPAIT